MPAASEPIANLVAGAAAADAQVWSIVELWDFGVAVDITPPDPGAVLAPSEAYRLAEQERPGPDA